PAQLFIDLASGFVFPAVRLALMLVMIYVGARRRMPWKLLVVSTMVVIVFMVAKTEFRNVAWKDSSDVVSPIDRGLLFLEVTGSLLGTVSLDDLVESLGGVARRVDLLTLFAFVVNETPDMVPYWGGETYTTLVWKALPRLLYPEKPMENVGQTFG